MKENREKYHDINILKKIMELAKLNSMSYGRTVINWEDYQLGCEFLLWLFSLFDFINLFYT